MEEQFKIYIPHLRDDHSIEIDFQADPAFMDVDEPQFSEPVSISGEAYTTSGELILHLTVATEATIPCSVCNEPVVVPLENRGFYHTIPLSDIKGGNYNFSEAVRENLLIVAPDFVECSGGKCPNRETMKQYFKEPGSESEDEGQRPFANL